MLKFKDKWIDDCYYVGDIKIGGYHWNGILSRDLSEEERKAKRYTVYSTLPRSPFPYAPSIEEAKILVEEHFINFITKLGII